MNAQKRFERERPYAARVEASAKHLSTTVMLPDQARTAALFAIAHALLDVSDAIRDHARTTRKEDQ
ncbi:hypothetical protein [Brachybacterium sp.]|uniref:hypothetical protein n=1 Tax=Brachybacterium sp. TaxID=1891286 RepID=UPI002ECFBDFD